MTVLFQNITRKNQLKDTKMMNGKSSLTSIAPTTSIVKIQFTNQDNDA